VRRPALLLVLAALAAALDPSAPAGAASRAPRLTAVRCVPPTASTCRHGVQVRIGKQLQLRGRGFVSGMRVTFRWPRGAIATKLRRTRAGWTVRVPAGVATGRVAVTVTDRRGHRSNAVRIRVLPQPAPPDPQPADGGLPAVFRDAGMWIWQLSKAEGGSPDAIAARAAAAGIRVLYVKGADGTQAWPQFSRALVDALHAYGLRVCAYQFIYGSDPAGEAAVGAGVVAQGADCLVLDAETKYEGRYAAAQRYLADLRAVAGPSYPLGLTSFPYVDYHPGLPYSVFLGPGGAQANLPQVYWKDIGGGVDAVSAHTLAHNRIFDVPMAPIGQTYDGPPSDEVQRFRQVWSAYGAGGLSWWSWQHTSTLIWATLGTPAPPPATLSDPGWPALGKGAKGDEVVWLQEHLTSAYPAVSVTGLFDAATGDALADLQQRHGLPPTRVTDAATWAQVLALPLRAPAWTVSPQGVRAAAATRRDRAPASATLPARRAEIPPPADRG
jgi:peptidoglycan hydrolase-like protein with peptidoglycan-binding domain